MTGGRCVFSPCRTYRYLLTRSWGELFQVPRRLVMFIGLNPSTADEEQDDPTIRRCIGFAKDWGFAGLVMGNLFAFRATDPRDMLAAEDPVGPENDQHLLEASLVVSLVVAAWGVRGAHRGRGDEVAGLIPDLSALGLTKDGHPRHPLYLPRTQPLCDWPKNPPL